MFDCTDIQVEGMESQGDHHDISPYIAPSSLPASSSVRPTHSCIRRTVGVRRVNSVSHPSYIIAKLTFKNRQAEILAAPLHVSN